MQAESPETADTRALRDKYERLYALRTAHERAQRDPTFVEPNPRDAMAALAEEFPGSLRELDMLPLETIAQRIDALARAEARAADVEPWMRAQAAFHRLARGALAAKRWLGGRRDVDEPTREAFLASLPALPRGEDARLFADELERVASPPRGRLLEIVYERLARELDLGLADARDLAGVPRRSARRR